MVPATHAAWLTSLTSPVLPGSEDADSLLPALCPPRPPRQLSLVPSSDVQLGRKQGWHREQSLAWCFSCLHLLLQLQPRPGFRPLWRGWQPLVLQLLLLQQEAEEDCLFYLSFHQVRPHDISEVTLKKNHLAASPQGRNLWPSLAPQLGAVDMCSGAALPALLRHHCLHARLARENGAQPEPGSLRPPKMHVTKGQAEGSRGLQGRGGPSPGTTLLFTGTEGHI